MPERPVTRAPGLTMFFPAYNDAGTIASLVIQAQEAIRQLTSDFEVIVVNDGSRDHTGQIADELARAYPNVRVIHHLGNRGYGGALRSGFGAATKELIAYTDGDAQYDPSEIATLWARLDDEADMVTGYKISRSDPFHRIIIGRLYHHAVKLLFALRVRDVDCDFRLMRREVFDRVRLERDSGVICLELMRKVQDAGFRVVEVPVHHYHRTHGRSQFFNVRRIVRTAIDVAKLWIELVVLGRGRQSTPVLFRDPAAQRHAPPRSTTPGARP
jgi:glycosyltransferase involved in cell wall biosynthesis